MYELPIETDGRRVSHLAVRLDRPQVPHQDDTVVLYLHGFGSDQAGAKAEHFRLRLLDLGLAFCSFDFQGHGRSGGPMFDLTLSRNLEDIGRVHGYLRVAGYRRLILFGSSMGGGSALWYAAFHPDDVAAAVLIAPSVEMDVGLLRRLGPENTARWEREGHYLLEHELGATDLGWSLIEDLRTFKMDRLQRLYRTPTLAFQGKKDESVAWRSVLEFVVGCEHEELELHLLADGDHRLLGRLEHLARLVESFLISRELAPPRRGKRRTR